ncbi:MAG: (2Fe-2S)-binding protein [Gemmatimonadetes bacterium]|nr:(2Fe-2S)-binding protein [Gemmatimonadota bacterium]
MRRLPAGGLGIDRSRTLAFTWNGAPLAGFAGDTLASALLGAGVRVLGASVSAGRPRGIMSAGLEEATGFTQVHRPPVAEPLVRTTALPLQEGLSAHGRIVRGALVAARDTARFDRRYAHCDLLVVGGGPAGLAAALEGARAGARVIVAECAPRLGGALRREARAIDGAPAEAWLAAAERELEAAPEVTVLTGTTAVMPLDQNGMWLAQRVGAGLPGAARGTVPEQRLWQVRARAIVLATGALERPLVFPDNDRPGIMLAGAARHYLRQWALAPACGVLFTAHDDAYRTALAWHEAGVPVAAVIDLRPPGDGPLRAAVRAAGVRVLDGAQVVGTDADAEGALCAVRVRAGDGTLTLETDLLATSAGHDPNLHLHLHLGGASRYEARLGTAVPAAPLPGQWLAGAVTGGWTLAEALTQGATAARAALGRSGAVMAPATDDVGEDPPGLTWQVPAPDGDESRSFVDLHRDATVAGIRRAVDAGATHVEHVKRYTLVGTGVEQGRAAKVLAAALVAERAGHPASVVGTSGSRPPVEPIPFHLVAGRAQGARFDPVRTTALHAAHQALGAVFEPAGQWLRASRYPRPGETSDDTVRREVRAVRTGVGLADVSTLGKLDVRGPDAGWVLDQLYVTPLASLPEGKARYAVLCHLDGSVLDDGVVMRTGADRYFVTTSTGHAAAVGEWMEEWLQTEWPDRRCWVTLITEQFTTVAIAGPAARTLLARVAPGLAVDRDAFPFLAVRTATVAGIADAQVARVSFSGELAFEVSVPWHDGPALWGALLAEGATLGVTPYGLDALQVLRIEKGYLIVGQDTEALTTPHDAGLGWMVPARKAFVGRRSLERDALRARGRAQLVGFRSNDPQLVVPEGAALTRAPGAPPMPIDGHVSSSRYSPTLACALGLALVRDGRARLGEVLHAPLLDGRVASVTLVDPVHYDPEGARRDGADDR